MSAETDPKTLAEQAAKTILDRFGVASIDVALVLGSGWSGAASGLGEAIGECELADLPGFAKPVVVGHGGQLVLIRTGTGQARPHSSPDAPTSTRDAASRPSSMACARRPPPARRPSY